MFSGRSPAGSSRGEEGRAALGAELVWGWAAPHSPTATVQPDINLWTFLTSGISPKDLEYTTFKTKPKKLEMEYIKLLRFTLSIELSLLESRTFLRKA